MESSLHRQLKALYAPHVSRQEVALDGWRIDAVCGDELIEIQHGSLAAIRDKVRQLLARGPVRVVKPIVVRKTLIKLASRNGVEVSRRRSPKQGRLLDLFDELVYFTKVFPHPNLTIDAVLVEVEEVRYPGRGRRRRRRADRSEFVIQDQILLGLGETRTFRTPADLAKLLPKRLPPTFHTQQIAELLGVQRHIAQRIAYCLRETGAVELVGKQGNALLYRRHRHPPIGRWLARRCMKP